MLSGCRLSVVCGWVGVGDVHVCVTQTQNGDRDVCVCVYVVQHVRVRRHVPGVPSDDQMVRT